MIKLTARAPQPFTTPQIHLGSPTHVLGLTVFPVWTDQPLPRRAPVAALPRKAVITELSDGPSVGHLLVNNPTTATLLLVEGLLVAGGWQHRVLTHSHLVGAHSGTIVDVRCVEHGRWGGADRHGVDRRRAPLSVRGALRGIHRDHPHAPRGAGAQRASQGEVWSRVDRYQDLHGPSPTSSLLDVLDLTHRGSDPIIVPAPLPGQRGVLIGVGGHPALLEVFDHPRTLARQLAPIIEGVLVDTIDRPRIATSGRRARTFAAAAGRQTLAPAGDAGSGLIAEHRDQLIDVRSVTHRDGSVVHTAAVNVRHDLVAA